MNITLTIQSEDYGFVVEAIKLRTMSMVESLNRQFEQQVEATKARSAEVNRIKAEHEAHKEVQAQVEKELNAWHKKVKHQPKAPYGYKKDGTPKKKPGRPIGF